MAIASIFMLLFASMFFIGLFFIIVNTIMIIVWKVRKRRNKTPKKWWFIISIIGLVVSIMVTLFPIAYINYSIFKNREEKKDYRFEKVMEALEKKDKDALKAVFSKQALSDADDLDEKVNYLFGLFDEKIESWEKEPGGEEVQTGDGMKCKRVDLFYELKTKKCIRAIFA